MVLGQLLSVRDARAQEAPEWRVARDLRIYANTHDLSPIDWVTAAPNGTIVISQAQDTLLRFYDAQGRSLGTFGRGGAGPGEFRIMAAHGWVRDTLWVNDPVTRRVTYISPDRKLVRSVMGLSAIRVPGRTDTATTMPWIFPQSVFGDGSMFVIPLINVGGPTPPWPGASRDHTQILHVRGNGAFAGLLATRPRNLCQVSYPRPGGGGEFGIPYCGAPMDDFAQDGSRYASAIVIEQGARRTRYSVTVIRGSGDTAFSRIFETRPRTIPRRFADSTLANWSSRAQFPEEAEAWKTVQVPEAFAPYARILVGRDETFWIEEFIPIYERRSRRWLVLDAQGNPVGRVAVPATVHIHSASLTQIWATETDDDGLQHVVRYRVSR